MSTFIAIFNIVFFMKKAVIFLCIGLWCSACANQNKPINRLDKVKESNNNSVEMTVASVVGTYKGVIPAADCPGIETCLVLNSNHTFEHHMSYIDRNITLIENGTFDVQGDLLTLKEKKGNLSYYRIKENQIRILTMDKKDIEGNLSEHFVLNKQ